MAASRHWIGFDLGGTKMLAKIFDSEFQSVGQDRTKTKGHEGVEAGLARIVKVIQGLLKKSDLKPQHVAGIGVGCPGPLDLDRGVIHNAPNLGWSNVPIKEHFGGQIQLSGGRGQRRRCRRLRRVPVRCGQHGADGARRVSRHGHWRRMRLRRAHHSRQDRFVHGDWPRPGGSGRTALWLRASRLPGGRRQPTGNCFLDQPPPPIAGRRRIY